MGEHEGWTETDEQLPNGLLPGAGPVMRALDTERWMKAERRTAELIACIQPNQLSEERRNAVADYVQRLIMKCFPCQVCTFGSVPLKTYLPDGDIDLTAFSQNPNLKDTWANLVKDILQREEKNENAEFRVKEVQYIQAEVKIIKCLVENIVVDISFNQVGGLCTLCFLDEIDNLISQNHLFKRSIILIKAWCYYESRILGAHHGLISTYALETLVLYIFHVFNNSFHGPLEVLYRFLEFFSNFDWENFCVSLWGPVAINCLPDVTAEPPRKDSGELLLSKLFLEACSSVYAVFPGGQESNGQKFSSKHFNVIDPLRVNNNLGRSVSKGNFFRIRSAFAFGAKRLARLLDCPKENLDFEVNQFFMNTWKRHGSGHRPDAPGVECLRLSTPDSPHELRISNNGRKAKESSNAHGVEVRSTHTHNVSCEHGENSYGMFPMKSDLSSASRSLSLKSQFNLNSLQVTDHIGRDTVPDQVVLTDKNQRDLSADHSANDTEGRRLIARTHSSPELTDNYSDVSSQVQHSRHGENTDARAAHSRLDSSCRRNGFGPETLFTHNNHTSVEDTVARSHQILDASATNCVSNSYALSEEFATTSGTQLMHPEDQDIVNMMASASLQGFNGQVQVPVNLTSGHLPYSIPPSFLASMGYNQQNFPRFVPANIPMMDPSCTHLQFPHGLVSSQLTQYFPSIGLNSSEESLDRINENFGRMDLGEANNEFWQEQDSRSSCPYDLENGNLDTLQSHEKPSVSQSGLKYIPPQSRVTASSSARTQQRHLREKCGAERDNTDSSLEQDINVGEVHADEKSGNSRFSSAVHSNSLRSRTSSESSWDGSSGKAPKFSKEKRGKKIATDLINNHVKGKVMSEHASNDTDDDQERGSLSNLGTEVTERYPESEPDVSLHVSRHHMPDSEVAQTSGSDSMMPFAPVLIGPGSRHRMSENSGVIAFYPTGPPIPFLAMLPVYNIPPEAGIADASSGHFGGHETVNDSESVMNINPKGLDQLHELHSSRSLLGISTNETSKERKPDILNSDFVSHWQSLQFGRVCQNLRYQGPSAFPSPVMVPPSFVQGQLPFDNLGRPLSTNANLFSQLMTNYGHHMVPIASLQSVSGRHPNIYQSYMDDVPRYRSGTGTYLPNPKITSRDYHSSGSRRGNYNHDRNDNLDKEVKWTANSKSRAASRSHNRNQTEKTNPRTERYSHGEGRGDHRFWNSYRNNSTPSYQSQNVHLHSNFGQDGPQNVAYNMYPLAAMNPNGVSNGPSVPPVMMMYPYDHDAAYASNNEQLDFGSPGQSGLPDANEQSQLNDGNHARASEDRRLHGSSAHCSSPDQPTSPHHHG
ncbi:uncharacterized protein LOC121777018 isoform X1 [Salvia splendens]|uniref:uncharacterized protein LOC121777018 isoform X1 n=1 Tax=Salvia splendens TaxID=180675 RepID=UPI001C274E16|nr:uncharacterized protein LOC121777018 isoform X1 [Salvia splendens]XP_042030086.1 uncharacterized protein LOC121777018 isoform X1 [Salvia splendens]